MENSKETPVEVLPGNGRFSEPARVPASAQIPAPAQGSLSASPWDMGSPVAASRAPPLVTYPDVPRLPLQDAAIALVKGEPGAGWSVARDVAEVTAIVALGMGLTGCKDVWKPAFASALLVEAMVVAYTAAGIRACDAAQQAQNSK